MAQTQLRIKEILTEKGISQKDFAEKLGISRISLNQNFKKNNFTLETLEKYASILEVDVVDFFQAPNTHPGHKHLTCPKCGTPLEIEIKAKSEE